MPVIQTITTASGTSAYVPTARQLTINGVTYDLTADRSWTIEVLDNLIATAPLSYNSGTNTISISQATNSTDGYLSSADWLTFSSKQNAITLTTTGNSGAASLVGATLNIPEYTLAGLGGFSNPMTSLGDIIYGNAVGIALRRAGNITTTKMFLSQTGDGTSSAAPQWSVVTAADTGAVPTSRQLTINGTAYDLTADRSWSVGTVTSVSALTIGTTGTDITSSVANGTTTPVITLNIPTASATNRGALSSTDWSTFNAKEPAITAGTTSQYYRGDKTFQTLNTTAVTEATNLYYTDARARAALSFTAGSGAYNSTTGVITIPTNTNQLTNGAAFITLTSLSAGTGISYNNTTGVISSTITQYTDALARASISETITGIDYNSSTGVFSITAGYGIPTTTSQTNWDNAYTNRITSLTTTGSSGAATLISNTLNIPNYTAAGLGAVPTSRTITINDVAYDLSADRSWSVGDFGTW